MEPMTGKYLVGLFILWICALRAEVVLLWLQQRLENRLRKPTHSPVKRCAQRNTIEAEDLYR